MARNGSDGTYALADTVAPATLADANEVMTIFNDLATEMTASIAKDGQTPITGQLKGLVSANPGHSFNGDLDTGLGSSVANTCWVMCGGTQIGVFGPNGFNVASGSLLVAGVAYLPAGLVIPYAGATAPGGWVLGHGGSIGDGSSGGTVRANADTLDLFTLIWNTSNIASGEGQVQDSAGTNTARGANAAADFAAHKRILLADMSDRAARGKSGSTSYGQTLGADSVTVAQGNLPNVAFTHSGTTLSDPQHAHAVTDTGHKHIALSPQAEVISISGGSPVTIGNDVGLNTDTTTVATGVTINNAATGISVAAQGSAASGGSGTALDIKGKALVKSFIIKL